MSAATQIRLIHVACRNLGLDEDTRRDLQLVATGKSSLTAMNDRELEAVVAALKARGFKPTSGKTGGESHRKTASRGDTRFAHVLWGKLVKAGSVNTSGARGLNGFIRTRFEAAWGAVPLDVDQMQDAAQIATVVEALKAMCRRAGIEL